MRAVVLVALVGCAGPTRLQVMRTNLMASDVYAVTDGTCPATMTVRVLDGARNPVPGATVTSHEGERMNAPSMVPTQMAYATVPVITNARGEATVCRPDRLLKHEKNAMFTHSTGAYIEAKFTDRTGRLLPPYDGAIILRAP
jgi:hypothetical protein